jgi:hypothetical protein
MTTLNDISTKLNILASEVGGGHLSNEKIEETLRDISKEVFDLAFKIRKSADIVLPFLGISERTYRILLRQENIEQNSRREVSE